MMSKIFFLLFMKIRSLLQRPLGILLSGTTLAWFAPLLEKKSPFLKDFEAFYKEFQASFKDIDNTRMAINKIRRLRQGDRSASAYIADFRLLACDIPWD